MYARSENVRLLWFWARSHERELVETRVFTSLQVRRSYKISATPAVVRRGRLISRIDSNYPRTSCTDSAIAPAISSHCDSLMISGGEIAIPSFVARTINPRARVAA